MLHAKNIPGILYIVATPIGNREDITLRALRILREVDLIAAEDTRHSKLLLQHYDINTPLISLHEFNQAKRSPLLIERLMRGESIALISDAGTPLISDPGYLLVQAVQAAGIRIVPIPGACAAITALCASGLPAENFIFHGFLPTKPLERKRTLQQLSGDPRTLIFYEAPHRILNCLDEIIAVMGVEREVALARELTKTFETLFRGTAQQAYDWLQQDTNHQRGEFVVLVHGVCLQQDKTEISPEALRVLDILSKEVSLKQAIALTAQITGVRKNQLKQKNIQPGRGYCLY